METIDARMKRFSELKLKATSPTFTPRYTLFESDAVLDSLFLPHLIKGTNVERKFAMEYYCHNNMIGRKRATTETNNNNTKKLQTLDDTSDTKHETALNVLASLCK